MKLEQTILNQLRGYGLSLHGDPGTNADHSSLAERPSASSQPVGTTRVIAPPDGSYVIISTVRGSGASAEWYSQGSSASLSDLPSAATFGKGIWQIGGTLYFSDGTTWIEDEAYTANPNDPSGASVSGQLNKLQISSVAKLVGLMGDADGQRCHVTSYHDNWQETTRGPVGGGDFVWNATLARSNHNGVTIFSPTVPWDGTLANHPAYLNGTGETFPAGMGCWVRKYEKLNVFMAGLVADGVTDDGGAIKNLHGVVAANSIDALELYGNILIVGGLSGITYEWSNLTIYANGASITIQSATSDNVGLQLGSNLSIIGELNVTVTGTSNGNGFVRTPVCVGRWWDASHDISNIYAETLNLNGMPDNTGIAFTGNTHNVFIQNINLGASSLGVIAHWAAVPNNISPTTSYHPHDIKIGTVRGAGILDSLVNLSACYNISIDRIIGNGNAKDICILGGDFGDFYAGSSDIGKVCRGIKIGSISSIGATDISVEFNASSGLIAHVMAGDVEIDEVNLQSSSGNTGVRLQDLSSGGVKKANISGFINNFIRINNIGGTDGEIYSSNAKSTGIIYNNCNGVIVDILSTKDDNQNAAGGAPGIQFSTSSTNIDINTILVSTNNSATHGCTLSSTTSDIRIKNVRGTVDASRYLVVNQANSRDNSVGYCKLSSGTPSYSGPDSGIRSSAKGFVTLYGSAAPTTQTWYRGDRVLNISATAKDTKYWVCISGGAPGTWRAEGPATGTTAERPTLSVNDGGFTYFDTTIGYPIFWSGASWVKSDGTAA